MTRPHSHEVGVSRRSLLQVSAATGASLLAPGVIRGQSEGPSQRIRIAFIGTGGRAAVHLRAHSDEQIVAVCDVDEKHGAEGIKLAKKQNASVKVYKDYRRMLEDLHAQLDAVVVSTPDHSHFPAALLAIQLGLHVYVEKPLAKTVYEVRTLHAAAREHGVITQMGNQGHSRTTMRMIREWIQAGLIGPVREVHLWTNRSGIGPKTLKAQPVPGHLEWDLWLGPARPRPYNKAYLPGSWRPWWSFGRGPLGDIGCHTFDAPFWALDLDRARQYEIEAESTEFDEHCVPKSSVITWRFPARGEMPPVKVVWHENDKRPDRPEALEEDRELGGGGAVFYGDRETLYAPGMRPNSCRVIPEKRMQALKSELPPATIPRVNTNHAKAWANAIRDGHQPSSSFDYSAPLTETVLLGSVAVRARAPIAWDADAMEVTNNTEANKYLRPYIRAGWDFE